MRGPISENVASFIERKYDGFLYEDRLAEKFISHFIVSTKNSSIFYANKMKNLAKHFTRIAEYIFTKQNIFLKSLNNIL